MRAFVAGGAGYIGGVTVRLLTESGHEVTVFDNLSTGHKANVGEANLVEGDITNPSDVTAALSAGQYDIVLNFAAKIRVEESVEKPFLYFSNNVIGALNLIDASVQAGIKHFIFSSSAAVYGQPPKVPITESSPLQPINPYGHTKLMIEELLTSYQQSHGLGWLGLRYFNAAGAQYGIGPDYPFVTHLIPKAIDAMLQNQPLKIFGTDYPTPDGTCVRDYVHVADIAQAHLLAAEKMISNHTFNQGINLGTGHGYSIKEVVGALQKAAGQPIPVETADRRAGDPAILIASNQLAKDKLGWSPERSLDQIVTDALAWKRSQ